MMEEPQNNPEPQSGSEHEAPAKGPAKVIRAGGEAKAGPSHPRGRSGDGDEQGPVAAPAASAAVPILRAGRQALEGAEAVGQKAIEGAQAASQQALEGAEAALREAEEAEDGASAQVLREWVHCAQRAYVRNIRALSELLYCRTPYGLLQWQSNLLRETTADLSATNSRIVRLVSQEA